LARWRHGPGAPLLPNLIELVLPRKIDSGRVFDFPLPLADVAEGYKAMDERRDIKTMLRVSGTSGPKHSAEGRYV
jgi:threonine dehydrogenase-like Zn-dependent dehydrogenase